MCPSVCLMRGTFRLLREVGSLVIFIPKVLNCDIKANAKVTKIGRLI